MASRVLFFRPLNDDFLDFLLDFLDLLIFFLLVITELRRALS